MMKSLFKDIGNKKQDGYTLIELVFSIFLISIISYALLKLIFASNIFIKNEEDFSSKIFEIEFGLQYIVNELDSADILIINGNGNKFDDILGILIVKINDSSIEEKYSITTYINDRNQITRLNEKRKELPKKFYDLSKYGSNALLGDIVSFETEIDKNSKTLTLRIENEFEILEKKHYIRGKIYESK